MFSLSTRAKEAIKTGVAMVIVFAIAMQMGWEKPFWAGLMVATCGLMSTGVSLTRGAMRSLGSLVGGVAALASIAMFPQQRWEYLICASLFIGYCTYMLTGKKEPYFWFICALTFLLVMAATTPPESQDFFQTAMMRTVETTMGPLVYILVAVFLWPQSSVGAFNAANRRRVVIFVFLRQTVE